MTDVIAACRPTQNRVKRRAPAFATTTVVHDGVRIVRVSGVLDLAAHACATVAFRDDRPGRALVIDLTDLTFMDCGGYRSVAAARADALQRGATFDLVNARAGPARLLDLIAQLGLLGIERRSDLSSCVSAKPRPNDERSLITSAHHRRGPVASNNR